MAKKKKQEVEEINVNDLVFPDSPSIPLPPEPSVEEQIAIATMDLERKNNDLIQQIYYKEQEIAQLKAALEDQAGKFETCIANLVYDVYGR